MIDVTVESEIQNQVLTLGIGISGVPDTLRYRSDRVAGFRPEDTVTIQVTGKTVAESLTRVELEVSRGDTSTSETFPPEPNQTATFQRDSEDDVLAIRLGYVYPGSFESEEEQRAYEGNLADEDNGPDPTVTADPSAEEITIWRESTARFAGDRWSLPGLQGWTFESHHAYDPATGTMYVGEGQTRSVTSDASMTAAISASNWTAAEEGYNIPAVDGSQVYVFDAAGRHRRTVDPLTGTPLRRFRYTDNLLTGIVDGSGNEVTIEYDDGTPSVIVSPYGDRIELETTPGRIERIDTTAEEAVRFEYDDGDLLTAVTAPGGRSSRFEYDKTGRLDSETDARGAETNYLRTQTDDVTITRALSPELREYEYRVESLADGGQRRVNTCCGGVEVTSTRTDGAYELAYPDGTTGRVTEQPDPLFGESVPLPDDLSIVTVDGSEVSASIDRTVETTGDGTLATMTTTVERGGRVRDVTYRASERTVVSTSPEERRTVTVFDEHNRLGEVRPPGQQPFTIEYDDRGRPVATGWKDRETGGRTEIIYDEGGRPATITGPTNRAVDVEYDTAGRVSSQSLPGDRKVQYTYDNSGNLAALTTPTNWTHEFEYTAHGRVSEYAPPGVDGASDERYRYQYDGDDRLTRITEPSGRTTVFTYGDGGRLQTASIARGSTRYEYDGDTGTLQRVTSPDGIALSYTYEGSRPTSVAWSGPVSGTLDIAYGDDGVASSYTAGDTTIEFAYDDDGLPVAVGDLQIDRDPEHGRRIGSSIGDLTDRIEYDKYGRPIHTAASGPDGVLYDAEREFDQAGRLLAETEVIEEDSHHLEYDYDPAGRLKAVVVDGEMDARFEYDANGNRIRMETSEGTVRAEYDKRDRIQRQGDVTYKHTADGDRSARIDERGTTGYEYDAAGNLTEVTLPDGTGIEYLHDGHNRRVGRRVDDTPDYGLLYRDGITPIAEVDGDGAVVSVFVYAGDENVPMYLVREDVTYRIVSDYRGSPRLVVDVETGAVVQRLDYDPWGRVVRDTNPGFQPFGFAGGIYDPDTGFVRFGARDYDPETGRWTAPDPIGFAGGTTNLYEYVANDPVSRTDPVGLILPVILVPAAIWIPTLAGTMLGGLMTVRDPGATFSSVFLASMGAGIKAGVTSAAGWGIGKLLEPAVKSLSVFPVFNKTLDLSRVGTALSMFHQATFSTIAGVIYDLITTRRIDPSGLGTEFVMNFVPGLGTLANRFRPMSNEVLEGFMDEFTPGILDLVFQRFQKQPGLRC